MTLEDRRTKKLRRCGPADPEAAHHIAGSTTSPLEEKRVNVARFLCLGCTLRPDSRDPFSLVPAACTAGTRARRATAFRIYKLKMGCPPRGSGVVCAARRMAPHGAADSPSSNKVRCPVFLAPFSERPFSQADRPSPRAFQGRAGHRASHGANAIHKLGPEEDVGVVEHPLLERHDDELRVGEVALEHRADVLRVGQVQRGIDLVQDVHGCRFEEKHGQHEGEGNERPLSAAELRQRVFPNCSKSHADLQSLHHRLSFWWLQLRCGAGKQGRKD
mmetsp:Transcript_761/g.2465  ORF Transcript_761/g.2465 Transcript_761/m.2465 type:complete len:274 (+) Transcript_761:1157-1978(+)